MTHVGYLAAGWGTVVLVLAFYSWRLVRRGRILSARVPDVHRRWLEDPGFSGG